MEYKYTIDRCINCGTKAYNGENTRFCINCGEKLYNYCGNSKCFVEGDIPPLPREAKYCPYCGSKTIFAECSLILEDYCSDYDSIGSKMRTYDECYNMSIEEIEEDDVVIVPRF